MGEDLLSKFEKKFDKLSSSHDHGEELRNQLMEKVLDLNEAKKIQRKLQSDLMAIDLDINQQKLANKQKKEMLIDLMMERDKLELMKTNLINIIDKNDIQIKDTKDELERFAK